MINDEERECAVNNIIKYNYRSFFVEPWSKKWLESFIEKEDRNEIHPFFWLLQEDVDSDRLASQLDVLKNKCAKYNTIIKKLIVDDFYSVVAEIEVMSFFYKVFGPDIEYEPKIEGTERKPDLKITFIDESYFVEISLLKNDEREQKMDELEFKVMRNIEALKQPYILSFTLENCFKEDYLGELTLVVKELSSKDIDKGHHYHYRKNGNIVATVIFEEKLKEKGFVSAFYGHMRAPNIVRVKNKLLDKVKERQLPDNAYNILIIKVKDMYARSDSTWEQAFYGEKTYEGAIDQIKHKSNGFIHDEQSKNVSAVVLYKNDFRKRKLFLNPFAKKPLNKEFIKKLTYSTA